MVGPFHLLCKVLSSSNDLLSSFFLHERLDLLLLSFRDNFRSLIHGSRVPLNRLGRLLFLRSSIHGFSASCSLGSIRLTEDEVSDSYVVPSSLVSRELRVLHRMSRILLFSFNLCPSLRNPLVDEALLLLLLKHRKSGGVELCKFLILEKNLPLELWLAEDSLVFLL